MQPASPQAMECAISPVQFPASAERVTFEGAPPCQTRSRPPSLQVVK